MLTCQQVLDYLSDYVEGRLPEVQAVAFDGHLTVCPPCVDYLRSFRETLAACRSLRNADYEALRPVPTEVVQAIAASRRA
jgi:anti-sigma factor RsiW